MYAVLGGEVVGGGGVVVVEVAGVQARRRGAAKTAGVTVPCKSRQNKMLFLQLELRNLL